jgi:lysophospholipase L1-like esterase
VAAIGDSLTSERSGGGGYLKRLRALCPESRFDDLGVGGQMVNQMRRRFARDVLGEGGGSAGVRYDHVIVFGGVNDLYSDLTAGRTVKKITADLGAMYGAARAQGLRVVAVTVAPWGGFTRYFNASREASTLELNRWILGRVKEGAVDVAVDAFPLLACGSALCEEVARPHRDGLHFGPEGHRRLAEALHRSAFGDCR